MIVARLSPVSFLQLEDVRIDALMHGCEKDLL